MTIKVNLTNLELRMAQQAAEALGTQRLPVKASLRLAKLKIALDNATKPVEEARIKLVKVHQKMTEPKEGEGDPKPVTKPDGSAEILDMELFQKEFKTLMDDSTEVTIDELVKIPEMVFSTCDKCKHNMDRPLEVESNILAALSKFIDV